MAGYLDGSTAFCPTPGCRWHGLPHEVCETPVEGGVRLSIPARPVTVGRPEGVQFKALAMAALESPVSAALGLALLVLLWLSGCA